MTGTKRVGEIRVCRGVGEEGPPKGVSWPEPSQGPPKENVKKMVAWPLRLGKTEERGVKKFEGRSKVRWLGDRREGKLVDGRPKKTSQPNDGKEG